MTDNPYSSPTPISEKSLREIDTPSLPPEPLSSKLSRIGMKALAWTFIVMGVNGFLGVVLLLYQKSNGPGGSAYLFSFTGYSMFLIPALAIQSGLLVKGGSKWAIATCSAILALCIYFFFEIYYRSPVLDQRSLFTQVVDQVPSSLLIPICGYTIALGFLVAFWKAGKLK